jgi:alpha/beta hydrolase family protein
VTAATARRRTLLAAALAAVPAAGTLLAPADAARLTPPPGTGGWRADPRHLPDPVRAGPVAVHRFFAGYDGGPALAAEYPQVVGNLDGAPVSLRYAANRRAMRAAGPPYRGWGGRFLLFDPRGNGRVAQVFGDLRTANRIAVLVPGSGNRADMFRNGVGGLRFRSPAAQAANLYRAAARDRFAVIAWLGYRTPQGFELAEAREDLAETGAAALVRLVAGLVAIRPHATVALLGHSYGSVVLGVAAPTLPRQVTDLAVFGSPGMGVSTAAQLGTTARIWAGQAAGDWIRWVPGMRLLGLGHGTKPTDPDFGARIFATRDVPDHDHYLFPGTDSLARLAGIAADGAAP